MLHRANVEIILSIGVEGEFELIFSHPLLEVGDACAAVDLKFICRKTEDKTVQKAIYQWARAQVDKYPALNTPKGSAALISLQSV